VPQLRGANQNPDAAFFLVVEKALWSQNSSPLSIFVVLGRICVLKRGKETSDLAKYFPPFKTQIGPKIKKIAREYFSASLLTAKLVRSSVTKTRWTPTSLHKLMRSEPKTGFFPLC